MHAASKGPPRTTVRFILDGEIIELAAVDPTRTVLQFLREDLGRVGTKEGCAEGDCGACTVALVELDRSGERLAVRAVNSCIQFLATLDGRELVTVESLKGADGKLHPAQQTMLDCHGSQCGFCTPGFVMSLFALFKNNATASRREIDEALAGNLCRCTGYKPIVDAAEKMFASAPDSGGWLTRPDSGNESAGDEEKSRVAALKNIQPDEALVLEQGGRRFFAPQTADELDRACAGNPDATLLAGGTDVGLWVTKQHRELQAVIYTGRVAELNRVDEDADGLVIGAGVTLSDAMPALLRRFPGLRDLFLRFASPPIRNAGTLGGNVANGSPIGDSMPALLALNATLRIRGGGKVRNIPLDDFYLGYQKNQLHAGEFLQSIHIPALPGNALLRSYKISKRFDQDISAVCGAFRVDLDDGNISDVRIAFGGVAEIPKRANIAEDALRGESWSEASIERAMAALGNDFQPIGDMRASAAYRSAICRNLLQRFWLEASGSEALTDVYNYGR